MSNKQQTKMKGELDLHKLAGKMANALWSSVKKWDYFTQDAVGREVAKAADNLWGEEGDEYSQNGRTVSIPIDDEIDSDRQPRESKKPTSKSSPIAISIEIDEGEIEKETSSSIAIAFDDEEEIEKEGNNYSDSEKNGSSQAEKSEENTLIIPSLEITFDEEEIEIIPEEVVPEIADREQLVADSDRLNQIDRENEPEITEADIFAIPSLEIAFDEEEIETIPPEFSSNRQSTSDREFEEEFSPSIAINFDDDEDEIETDSGIQDWQTLEEDEIVTFPVSIPLDLSDGDEEIETDSGISVSPEPIFIPPTMENQPLPHSPQSHPQPLRNPEGYEYFLTESRELLAEIEQQLFALTPEASTNEIYSLMRATHTLKGASANVGRETIKTIAHNLEDVFRAMLAPEATIDPELESLLFEGYECLRLAISADLTSEEDRDEDLLNRAADLFARFQVKLGDCFDHQQPLPTSHELGFDLTKSIFEVGVNQRIEELKELLSKGANEEAIATTLKEQANVFVGLGESLGLPGFGAIATTIFKAIEAHPEAYREIAQLALEDLECAQKAVLEGDRDRGGQPSAMLLELAGETATVVEEILPNSPSAIAFEELDTGRDLDDLLAPSTVEDASANVLEDPFSLKETPAPNPMEFDLDIVEEFPPISPTERQELEASFEELELENSGEAAIEFDLGDPFELTPERETFSESSLVREFGELEFREPLEKADPVETQDLEQEAIDLEEAFGNLDDLEDDFDLDLERDIQSELEPEREETSPSELIPGDVWDLELNGEAENTVNNEPIAEELFLKETNTQPTPQEIDNIPALEETFGSLDLQDTLRDFPQDSEPLFLEEPSPAPKSVQKTENLAPLPKPLPPTSIQPSSAGNPPEKTKTPAKLPAKTLRIDLEQLELFNHLIAELLINQNQLALRDEQFQTAIQKLGNWIRQHRLTLNQLRELVNRSISQNGSDRNGHYKQVHPLQKSLNSALEEALQITQATEDINLLAQTTTSTIEREQRLSNQLRDNVQTARMIPLESLLKRFPPMVKQLSFIHKKSVDLQIQGSQVMVDKTIIDNLYDALLHLVRNAFDHGIESPETRLQRGKSDVGNILIRAYNQGNRTIIEVRDDGEGLNIEKICQQGIKKGLIRDREAKEIQQLAQPESRLLDLLCSPGFSTTSRVSDLSGRGVGLDVVKTQLEQIKGTLELQSIAQQGTVFSLHIRESLMNARLLICQAGRSVYGFVSNEIEQVLIPGEKVRRLAGQKVLDWQQNEQTLTIPIYELASLFNYSRSLSQCRGWAVGELHQELSPLLTTGDNISPILLLKGNEGFMALEVDRILEEQELVIKPLSNALSPPEYIYGCTILADGRLALAIDGFALVRRSQNKAAIATQLTPKEQSIEEELPAIDALSTQNLGLYIPDSDAMEKTQLPSLPSSPLMSNTATIKTVLVIDDSLTERQTLTLILQRSGYRVLQAKDGLEALEQLKNQETIHVALCDVEMPRMNGLEFLSVVKQDKNLAHIPAIVLTSRSRDKFQQIALELGAYAYLTKPYLEREILGVVEEALQTVEPKNN